MWDQEIRIMVSAHAVLASSVILSTVVPAVLVGGFSVYETHLLWLYCLAGAVAVVNISVSWLSGTTSPTEKHTLSHKLSRLLRSCLYLFLSCLFYHTVVVLYGAPLIGSAVETFSLAVLLTSLTTLRCLCLLGTDVQAWIRVFTRLGATTAWDTSLQITVASTVAGAWIGAFFIPLNWNRPWQAWPITCSLGSAIGFLSGLVAAPAWICYYRKQLTYKCKG